MDTQIKQMAGFTLLELIVTVVIFAIIVAVAVPSMQTQFDKREVIAAAEHVYSNLQLARSESIARSTSIFVNFNEIIVL